MYAILSVDLVTGRRLLSYIPEEPGDVTVSDTSWERFAMRMSLIGLTIGKYMYSMVSKRFKHHYFRVVEIP